MTAVLVGNDHCRVGHRDPATDRKVYTDLPAGEQRITRVVLPPGVYGERAKATIAAALVEHFHDGHGPVWVECEDADLLLRLRLFYGLDETKTQRPEGWGEG